MHCAYVVSAYLVRGGGEPRPGNVERDAAELRLVRRDEAGGLLGVGQVDQLLCDYEEKK